MCSDSGSYSNSIPVLTRSDRSSSSSRILLLLDGGYYLEQQQMTDLRIALRAKNFTVHHECRNTYAYLVKSQTYSLLLIYIVGYSYSVLILYSSYLFSVQCNRFCYILLYCFSCIYCCILALSTNTLSYKEGPEPMFSQRWCV